MAVGVQRTNERTTIANFPTIKGNLYINGGYREGKKSLRDRQKVLRAHCGTTGEEEKRTGSRTRGKHACTVRATNELQGRSSAHYFPIFNIDRSVVGYAATAIHAAGVMISMQDRLVHQKVPESRTTASNVQIERGQTSIHTLETK